MARGEKDGCADDGRNGIYCIHGGLQAVVMPRMDQSS